MKKKKIYILYTIILISVITVWILIAKRTPPMWWCGYRGLFLATAQLLIVGHRVICDIAEIEDIVVFWNVHARRYLVAVNRQKRRVAVRVTRVPEPIACWKHCKR